MAATPVPPLVLISMDGFRWDYCERHPKETQHLRELATGGCSARSLVPVFPSNTFPNHYSIITGLYPAHHGIINAPMFDPKIGRVFSSSQVSAKDAPDWWGGEPIWNTAGRQGRVSACSFWPGSDAVIADRRPDYWAAYDYSIPFAQRLEEFGGWLRLPPSRRPSIITFYLEETNSVGHKYGPESKELVQAIKLLDERIGAIMDRLRSEGVEANVMIVSDHGMTTTREADIVELDDYVDLSKVQVDFEGTVVGLRPPDGGTEELMGRLATLPAHFKALRAEQLPARLHLVGNDRIPQVWILADEGWRLTRRATRKMNPGHPSIGEHGYDPAFENMHGILIVNGPSVKVGLVTGDVENVHLYNLMCALLRLQPAANDGDDRLVRSFLR